MTATWSNLEPADGELAQLLCDHLASHGRDIDEMGVDPSVLVLRTAVPEDLDQMIELHESFHPEDERAYSGEALPQRRELTARERDIIVRVLQDVKNAALLPARHRFVKGDDNLRVTSEDLDGLMFTGDVGKRPRGGVRLELDDIELIIGVMKAITPRKEN